MSDRDPPPRFRRHARPGPRPEPSEGDRATSEEIAPLAPPVEPVPAKPTNAETFRREARERTWLFARQLANILIDLVFLVVWAAMVAGLDWILRSLDAEWWLFTLSYIGDGCTALIVLSFIARDVLVSIRQMWQDGGD